MSEETLSEKEQSFWDAYMANKAKPEPITPFIPGYHYVKKQYVEPKVTEIA